MISAPLLTSGVPIELPKTEAGAMQDQAEPITLTVRANGQLYIGEDSIPFAALKPRLAAMASGGYDKPIYVRADGKAAYEVVAQVMAALATGGFSRINLITDTGGPSSGEASPAQEPPEK
jgi:biopolymer transport protein TolR